MRTITIIDDSAATLETIERVLRAANRVVSCRDGTALEEELEKVQPELRLFDVVLPGRSSYEILRKLRQRDVTAAIRVIVVSSKNEPHDVDRGLRQGAHGYLPTPFSDTELIATIRGMLER